MKQRFVTYMTEKRFTIEARWERWLTVLVVAVTINIFARLPFLVSVALIALTLAVSHVITARANRSITKEPKAGNQW